MKRSKHGDYNPERLLERIRDQFVDINERDLTELEIKIATYLIMNDLLSVKDGVLKKPE